MSQAPSPSEKAETLDATITYVEGLPTGVETESAMANIEEWVNALKSDGRPELISVANELKQLKQLLSSSTLNAKAIGKVLITLGDLTTQTASIAEEGTSERLLKLGSWLTKVGHAM